MTQPATPPKSKGTLGKRLLVALVLIPFALFVVWAGGWWLAAACVGAAIILGAEWSIMGSMRGPYFIAIAAAAPLIAYMTMGLRPALVALWIGAIALAIIQQRQRDKPLDALLGVLYTGSLPLGLLVLREGEWNGLAASLMLMGMVWASDSGAYFAGRFFRGPLLSPKYSPNKTWSGAIGGVIATSLCGLIAANIVEVSVFRWMIFAALLSVVCQYGDMVESRVKREFNTKDASKLLPGHGGLMDRVDGLGAVCVVASSLFIIFPSFARYMGLGG